MPRPETLQKLALENENDAQVCQYLVMTHHCVLLLTSAS